LSSLPSPKRVSALRPIPTLRSQFQALCEEKGGPILIIEPVPLTTMAMACEHFPLEPVWQAYREWSANESEALRYWPWIALAADLYRFERETKAGYDDEPKPSEVLTLLNNITTKAQTLRRDLMQLDALSRRLGDPEAPLRRGHLAWLRECISQSLTAGRVLEPSDNPEAMFDAGGMYETWNHLELLEATAKAALSRYDPKLLSRVRMQADRGLISLVSRCGRIWKALTKREPSVHRSIRQGAGDDKPPFARFVTNIAKLASGFEPELAEMATASKHTQLRKK
jgi:hypothetical protein